MCSLQGTLIGLFCNGELTIALVYRTVSCPSQLCTMSRTLSSGMPFQINLLCSFFLNWKITALQCCVSSCWTTWISFVYTCVLCLLNLRAILPPQSHSSRSSQSTKLSSLIYSSFPLAVYFTHVTPLFQFISPSPSPHHVLTCLLSMPASLVLHFSSYFLT